jgi:hypothetical protein
MSNGCPNCEAPCTICQDNTYNWHEPLCSSCRLAVAHTEDRIIKLLELEEDNWRCKEGCCECFGWNGNTPINQVGLLIALIKGGK